MNKKFLIIKNCTRENPGLIADVLDERGIIFDIIDLDAGDALPAHASYDAVIILGGPDSANDQTPKIRQELLFVEAVLSDAKPFLGICLGLQLLVKAAGGRVVPAPVKEVGFVDRDAQPYTIALTDAGKGHALFSGLGDVLQVFQLHGETVVPASGMHILGEGEGCRHQILQVAPYAYGIQCHFELTEALFETLIQEDPDLLVLDTAQLRKHFAMMREQYTDTGRKLISNFVDIVTDT